MNTLIPIRSSWPLPKGKLLTNAAIHRYWLAGYYDGVKRTDAKLISKIRAGSAGVKRCVQCKTTDPSAKLRKQPSGLVFCAECRATLKASAEAKRPTLANLLAQFI